MGSATMQPNVAAAVDAGAGSNGTGPALLALRSVSKRYGPVAAVNGVSLSLAPGEILGVLGENGAGKSTLLNIAAGMVKPDGGTIAIRGDEVPSLTPRSAIRRGIGTVYQHFALVPGLSVRDNLALGVSATAGDGCGRDQLNLRRTLELLDISAALDAPVQSLAMGERQRLEIARVVARGCSTVLLDEPTSVLTPQEVARLFTVLRRLRSNGVGVVLVTHKLGEALELCDRIVVMRAGRVQGEIAHTEIRHSETARERVVSLMFGQAGELIESEPELAIGQADAAASPLLSVAGVRIDDDRGHGVVPNISLDMYPGEIFGIAGVDGNGQRELAEALAGQRPVASGRMVLDGADLTGIGVAGRRLRGIGYVSDDRRGEGAALGRDIADNLVLKSVDAPAWSRRGLLDRRAIRAHARTLMQRFDIRAPGPRTRAGTLSGGNLQKVLLARELAAYPRLLVCKDPTHGLDVRTATRVLTELRSHAAAGNAVLVISSDLDELRATCHRIGVLYRGELVGVLPHREATPSAIGALMLGGSVGASI